VYMHGKSNIYKRKLYWRDEEEKMKNCVICLMECFTPLFTAWTWQTLFNHFQFVSAIALHHLTYFLLFSLLLMLLLLVFIFSRFHSMEMKKGNVFYEISNAMNGWEKKLEAKDFFFLLFSFFEELSGFSVIARKLVL